MTSPAISDLAALLASMQPELHAGTRAWCALPAGASLDGVDAAAALRALQARSAA